MNVTVAIPTPFQRHTEGVGQLKCAAANLNELLDTLSTKFPELKPHLRDEQGQVRRFLNIYVNDEDIRFLGAGYAFRDGDEVTLVPSIAGG
ncbi:MAG TPA: MoaD/ThiS family protein [Candidatus Angelobacter sp.]|nr:MoaD/ThiS family protein [Candidatus Angelobacter sp.]